MSNTNQKYAMDRDKRNNINICQDKRYTIELQNVPSVVERNKNLVDCDLNFWL